LDAEEKELLEAFEAGKVALSKNQAKEKALAQSYAANTLRKDRRVNIRISDKDLHELRIKAMEEGIPYQTLMSSVLHKFVSGRLIAKLQ
jgi:predicted DNA binding CopG/RHH family protein